MADTGKSSLIAVGLWALAVMGLASRPDPLPSGPPAQQSPPPAGGKYAERSISEWLMRMHEASRLRSYVGTFVVSSNTGSMSSARIWHACDGDLQVERVESLTGAPRSTFRRNDEVVTFLPESRVVRTEKRGIARPVSQLAEVQRNLDPRVLCGSPCRRGPGRRLRSRRRPACSQGQPALRLSHLEREEDRPGGQAADARCARATCSSRRPSPNCSWMRRCASTSSAR